MLRIYEWNEAGFTGNGLATLVNAADACVRRATNGDISLTFKLPSGDENWKYVVEERIVTLEGQQYRIKNIKGYEITAYPIYQDACGKHIQSTGDMIGKTVPEIMASLFSGTNVVMANDADLAARGMEWVKDKTDFFDQSKVTPIGALKTLMEQLDKYKIHNELYVDNNVIALVRQIGVDRGAKIDLRLNADKIEPTRDTSEMITRLYPYGADDLHIGSVNGGRQYIESQNINKFPMHEGYMSFDEIEDPEELLEAANAQFDPNNPDRIDVPKYSLEVSSFAEVGGVPIRLGDLVEVNDPQYNIKTMQRVVSEEYYPFEPNRRRVTVGQPEKSVMEIFDGVVSSTSQYDNSTNDRGEVKAGWLENLKTSYKTYINKNLSDNAKENRRTVIHDYGDIWVNPDNPNQAVALVGGVLALANGKTPEGDWDWSAFGDWTGFTADVITAGRLITDKVEVMSADGKLWISGGLITVFDSVRSRMRIGYDEINGEYIFEITDKAGNDTIKMDDTGQIEVSGTIYSGDTEDDAGQVAISGGSISGAKVVNGKTVAHGFSCSTDIENLENIVKADLSCNGLIGISIDVTANAAGVATATLFNQYMSFLRLNGGFTYAEGKWDFSSADVSGLGGVSGTFVDANGKLVRVTDGIITFIGN